MGGMMGTASGWAILWGLLALVLVVSGGIVAALALATPRGAEPPQVQAGDSPAAREARDALRLRYAHGEISREGYLRGKVELED